MGTSIDYIKNINLSLFGLHTWDIWIWLGIIIILFVTANWLASFLQPTTAQRTRKILAFTFYLLFFGIMSLVVLNSLLTEKYDRLAIIILLLILPSLKKWVAKFYQRYDKFMDRLINK
jgi:hypothetical protein